MGTTPRAATPSQWLKEAGEALQTANDDIDRLQVRVSALHDVALELRERLLAALTVLRRMEADSITFDPMVELTRALTGGKAEEIKWDAVRPDQHPLAIGTLVQSHDGECDCGGEPEEERETGHDAVGQIIDANRYHASRDDEGGGGWSYTVCFGNGTTVIIEQDEIEDPDLYAVAPAPFVSPEGV